ncbi:MAG: hypothetical protein Tsb0020_20140 [Haliangiales bacterium]
MSWYRQLIARQRDTIERAYAAVDERALAHKRGFCDQVVEYMRASYGLALPGAAEGGDDGGERGERRASGGGGERGQADSAGGTGRLGSLLIFSARSDRLPRGYWQPGIVTYQPFDFDHLDRAGEYMDERVAAGENLYVRAAPASADALGERLIFSEYPAIAMTAFHEALHNRIQLPLAVEEPLHTLLALALTAELGQRLPAGDESEARLRGWLVDGSAALRSHYLSRAGRYAAFLQKLDPERPDAAAINGYARALLAEQRRAPGSAAQRRYGRDDAPPYSDISLNRTLHILALEPAERDLLGTALIADYSTYERHLVAVHDVLAAHGLFDSSAGEAGEAGESALSAILDALFDHQVSQAERYSFTPEAEQAALDWLRDRIGDA